MSARSSVRPSVCPSVTKLVNTIFWKRMNRFRCKFAQVHGPRGKQGHERASLGGIGSCPPPFRPVTVHFGNFVMLQRLAYLMTSCLSPHCMLRLTQLHIVCLLILAPCGRRSDVMYFRFMTSKTLWQNQKNVSGTTDETVTEYLAKVATNVRGPVFVVCTGFVFVKETITSILSA